MPSNVDSNGEIIQELEQTDNIVWSLCVCAGVFTILTFTLFLVRLYIGWTPKCPSMTRLDGKTVIITGILNSVFLIFMNVIFCLQKYFV